ncbi:MAG: SMP-30/gluconolactonase/LRE family protein [Tepidisphaeraceae bacterium]
MQAELELDARAMLGEGAFWCDKTQRLYWVEITLGRIHIYDPVTRKDRVIDVSASAGMVGTVIPRANGGLVLAAQKGFMTLDPQTGKIETLVDPESDKPQTRFNDGACDAKGRFWAGTMTFKGDPGQGALYRLDPDHTVHKMVDKISISNGIAWNDDSTKMYYIDTAANSVDVFDYDLAAGTVRNRQTIIRFEKSDGWPDGMTNDAEGMLWVCHWAGSAVTRWDPRSGKRLQKIEVPTGLVTSPAFGGKEMDTLFLTTAREGMSEDALKNDPQAGGLFKCKPGVKGVALPHYAG